MGGLLLIIGLAVLGFGLMQHFKGKRILAAPFKKTGELAKNPVSEDPKGAMSTEGKVVPPATQLLSPCTKQACLSYEVKVERLYEKTETTQDGTKTVKGSETLETLKGGAVFGLDDGSGAIQIDVSKGADFDNYKDGFKKEINGHSGSSHIQFGELSFDVPAIGSDRGWTIGFKATEKFVPVEGSLFVLGKIEGASIVKPGWRSMMTSAKGRDGLLGSIQKKKKFSFIGGGVAAVLSIPLMIFGPKADPNAVSAYCESALTDSRQRCSDTVTDVDGEKYTWTVTKPGEYEISAIAPQKKISLIPLLVIKDSTGEELANESGPMGGTATATLDVKAGVYEVVVSPADEYMVKGGFSFDLQIKATKVEEPVVAAAGEGDADEAAPKKTGVFSDEKLTEQITMLNELCPDTFCEGQFNYQFKKLVCADATHCVLSFTAKDQEKKKAKPMDVEVAVAGFKSMDDEDLTFVDQVSESLLKWEENPVAVRLMPKQDPMAEKKRLADEAKRAAADKKAADAEAKRVAAEEKAELAAEAKRVAAEEKAEAKRIAAEEKAEAAEAKRVAAEEKAEKAAEAKRVAAEKAEAKKIAASTKTVAPVKVVAAAPVQTTSSKKVPVAAPAAPSSNRTSKNLED